MRRFNQILAAKSFTHLRAVFEEYSKVRRLTKLIIIFLTCLTDVHIMSKSIFIGIPYLLEYKSHPSNILHKN